MYHIKNKQKHYTLLLSMLLSVNPIAFKLWTFQLTWMAYDMVALRTNPEEGASMRQLEEAYQRCRAARENVWEIFQILTETFQKSPRRKTEVTCKALILTQR
uniref:Uncharacterized protein n=1 Tax=Oryzias latipes TaxID=8090 RepID=A0A3B3HJY0_ORYLA